MVLTFLKLCPILDFYNTLYLTMIYITTYSIAIILSIIDSTLKKSIKGGFKKSKRSNNLHLNPSASELSVYKVIS